MLVETKAKVGVFAIALGAYLPQFPTLVPEFEAQYDAFKKTIPDTVEMIDGGIVTTKELSMEAGDKFRAADVDLVILQLLTYATSYNMLPAVRDLNVPVVLVNVQKRKAPDYANTDTPKWLGELYACGAVGEMVADLERAGKRHAVITGVVEGGDDYVAKEIDEWCRAARQLEEPFEADQIGSSAMAYKRNPMRCERICSLSRYMIADAMNAPMTASVQWLERTLDDSANRRIAMPEGFLCIDAVLRLCQNVTAGLHVNEAIVNRTLREYLPFLATEDLMMEAVKRGGDRQQLHEVIRRHSMAATKRMKEGLPCDLLDRLAGDPVFGLSRSELEQLMEPRLYIGRCPQQVRKFLDACTPLLRQAQSADGDIRI